MIGYDFIKKVAYDIQKNIQMPLYIIDKSGNLIYGDKDFFEKKAGFLRINVEYIDEKEIYEVGEFICYNIFYNDVLFFTVALEVKDEQSKKVLYLISLIFEQLLHKYDREEFLIEALTCKLSADLVSYYTEKYKINKNVKYTVAIVESNNEIDDAIKIITNIFDKGNLYTVKFDDKRFAAIFSYKGNNSLIELYKTMKDMIEAEGYMKVRIASSSSFVPIEDIHIAYREAETALLIGKKLENEKGIYIYEDYSFAEILWGIDIEKINNFIKKRNIDFGIFKDEELIQTLNVFFRNSLNLSETARELYIHRNTLVYRLDKIFKMTGLDAKNFDDAVLLKTILVLTKLYDIPR
ncbi:carbohydrate diacid regulator [Thermoanaerobacter uzonensis DSM 18761]|uniref:Carbohydrate diacid regulator n=1 Tax=Thermoanaerobacter uzonensis DSM 18761 TaxID=1123369 RepID=A0A1M4VVC4_9THEO|nr:helix-turn-helix domain-containing protein [Thermoanaerobacter uzonensis]SHE72813.1 carbohydrate diacid regulator [Thermoanaerobacter uzonensis DSM 18761]